MTFSSPRLPKRDDCICLVRSMGLDVRAGGVVPSSHRAVASRRWAAVFIVVAVIVVAAVGTAFLFSDHPNVSSAPSLLHSLASPSPQWAEYFGDSVAISGGLAVVADDRRAPNATAGLADLYLYNATTGALIRHLASPAVEFTGPHYASVAISGDTVVAGALYYPRNGSTIGLVYVFNATDGALTHILKDPNSQAVVEFGFKVAVAGDLLITSSDASADVFNTQTGALVREITSPSAQSGGFGSSVAISGDLAVIGALDETVGGFSNAGSAYVFNVTTGALVQPLENPYPNTNSQFGISVAIDGKTVLVSGYGHVYAFDETTGKMIRDFTSPDNSTNYFGTSIAISGGLAVIGETGPVAGHYAAGRTFVFDVQNGALLGNISSPNSQVDGDFGASVSISGGFAIVGAPGEGNGGLSSSGRAYILRI